MLDVRYKRKMFIFFLEEKYFDSRDPPPRETIFFPDLSSFCTSTF